MFDSARLRSDLLALVALAASVAIALCLLTADAADPPAATVFPPREFFRNMGGEYGALTAFTLQQHLGFGAWLVPAMLALWSFRLLSRGEQITPISRTCGAILVLASVAVALQYSSPVFAASPPVGPGGYVGAIGSVWLQQQFTPPGIALILTSSLLAGLVLANELRLLKTAGSILLLPVTMWDRLAFRTPAKASQPRRHQRSAASPKSSGPVEALSAETIPGTCESTAVAAADASQATKRAVLAESTAALAEWKGTCVTASPSTVAGTVTTVTETSLTTTPTDLDDALLPFDAVAPTAADVASLVRTPPPLPSRRQRVGKKSAAASATAAGLAALPSMSETTDLESASTERGTAAPLIKVNPPMSMTPAGSSWSEHVRRPSTGTSSEGTSDDSLTKPFSLPQTDVLDTAEEFPYELLAQKAQGAAQTLERTFREFGLNVKVVEIDTGPVITQFELELEAGLRLAKVTSLADDLAIALRVPAVRVVAPIPGKNTVGVEVPNDVRVMVRLRELIDGCRAETDKQRIPLFLGKDVSGKPLVVDLAKMPHLLIAGRTGTGKSVCLNTLILSMLMSRSPREVKMLMIDPKMVELSPYMKIPHLMHPVITDMKKAEAVLAWAVDKMEERYDLLARVGVRHLDNYNKLGKTAVLERLQIDPDSEEADAIPEHMPYIVIVADEMADMMMTSGKDVEGHIIRLAQKSRAVGIHLVLATQKPTVDVITGLIKSNLPSRIAFQVSSRVDSRVVLDEQGADKLLGNGDMLYLAPGTSNLIRAQGTFVSDDEVMRIIEFFADQPPQYDAEIAQVTTAAKSAGKAGEPRERDDLYDQAVEIIIREGRGSVSLLQRALGVGYGRGARMIDWMAEDGVVGGFNGSQAREVVMTLDDWEDFKAGREGG